MQPVNCIRDCPEIFSAETNMTETFNPLKLENQLCFPLYVCAKEVIRRYKPFLDELDLTYTQYITMMALWEHRSLSIKGLGKILFLDSGTLTPVIKSLEKKGYVIRERSKDDERVVNVTLTEQGSSLYNEALQVPVKMSSCIELSAEEAGTLYSILHKLADNLTEEN